MQCLADDPASVSSAARAHSKLHKAAVLALTKVQVMNLKTQQQLDSSLLPYLARHGQHVDSGSTESRGQIPQTVPAAHQPAAH